jgi:hypothetical protein
MSNQPIPLTCKHCNGTTFCGGTKAANGTVKKRVACVSCVVRSALNPNVVYDRVLCSVCGGTGIVTAQAEGKKTKTPLWVLLVMPLMSGTILALIITVLSFQFELRRYKDLAEQLSAIWDKGRDTPAKEVLGKLGRGMKKADVKVRVGDPDTSYVPNAAGPEGQREYWYYNCPDGRVTVLFLEDTVEKVDLEARGGKGKLTSGKLVGD